MNRFRHNLREGIVFIRRNFKVTESMGAYRPVQSDIKVTSRRIMAIQNIQDHSINIPVIGFKFINQN